MTTLAPQVLTADEVGALLGMTGGGVRRLTRRNGGHVLGVRRLPDTGGRYLYSRVQIERALGLEEERTAV